MNLPKIEEIKKGVTEEISKFSDKYKGEFTYLSESETKKLQDLLGEMFIAGFSYASSLVDK